MTEANLMLCKVEYEKLLGSGYIEINDPERGHIKVWLLFDELSPHGINGKQMRLKILRPGSAAVYDEPPN